MTPYFRHYSINTLAKPGVIEYFSLELEALKFERLSSKTPSPTRLVAADLDPGARELDRTMSWRVAL
jgi:hypothetical protein